MRIRTGHLPTDWTPNEPQAPVVRRGAIAGFRMDQAMPPKNPVITNDLERARRKRSHDAYNERQRAARKSA